MQKWEYKTTDSLDEQSMNQLGNEGWELVSVTSENDWSQYRYLYFKRPKP
jgi:hypothetical protein